MGKIDDTDIFRYWGKAKKPLEADYCAGKLTDKEICEKHEIELDDLMRQVKRHGWTRLPLDNNFVHFHLLPYHCLDVAAVGKLLLHLQPSLADRLCNLSGLNRQKFEAWITFFLAIHDLGKFLELFQQLRPDLYEQLQGKKSNKDYYIRHDTLGYALWLKHIRAWLLGSAATSARGARIVNGFDFWAAAVMGHHGTPPEHQKSNIDISDDDIQAALGFVKTMAAFFEIENAAQLFPDLEISKYFSWWLAGFTVLCDWLGSNSRIFEFCDHEMPLDVYWQLAQERAQQAILSAQLTRPNPAPLQSAIALFSPSMREATPLQSLCENIDLDDNPRLFILEDVTGAGKTEASIILLHRLLAMGGADSVYFALPTTATSDAMYARMSHIYRRLFDKESNPSLVLAHSTRDLSDSFRQSIVEMPEDAIARYGDGTEPSSAHCSAWIADSNKKALLADVGVGTIDQSLLALLSSKHQSLRMLGLLGKVLIVDEVHACDAYMNELLCAVLKAHATSGGSAILMSATLPAMQRQRLLDAYQEGLGPNIERFYTHENASYPLLTCFPSQQVEVKVDTRESVKRLVKVQLMTSEQTVQDKIIEAANAGRCVCWIRNTVDDARKAYAELKKSLPAGTAQLFHARYAMADRLAIEQNVIARLGKDGQAQDRKGRVIVCTQIFSFSLDCDVDLMISDLAPIDQIIQRAGRLCRHTRDVAGNRTQGADQRGVPLFVLYGPDPSSEINTNWYQSYFKGGAFVYPHHGQLWLTAKWLVDKGGFRMPEDARDMINSVYGDRTFPATLQSRANEAEGKESSHRSLGKFNVLKLDQGYADNIDAAWWDEDAAPTRLGERTVNVYLARWDGQRVRPWAEGVAHPWPNSAVRVRASLLTAEANDGISNEAIEACKDTMPSKGKWGVLVVLTPDAQYGWRGTALGADKKRLGVAYGKELGLCLQKEGEPGDGLTMSPRVRGKLLIKSLISNTFTVHPQTVGEVRIIE